MRLLNLAQSCHILLNRVPGLHGGHEGLGPALQRGAQGAARLLAEAAQGLQLFQAFLHQGRALWLAGQVDLLQASDELFVRDQSHHIGPGLLDAEGCQGGEGGTLQTLRGVPRSLALLDGTGGERPQLQSSHSHFLIHVGGGIVHHDAALADLELHLLLLLAQDLSVGFRLLGILQLLLQLLLHLLYHLLTVLHLAPGVPVLGLEDFQVLRHLRQGICDAVQALALLVQLRLLGT
mmetsp:Transcript_94882/g.225933  ORF Transcript_94882/g.225933 Transcript_94882/m.225933 type:complete len:235 (-) Transcript_94882:229-933(-)